MNISLLKQEAREEFARKTGHDTEGAAVVLDEVIDRVVEEVEKAISMPPIDVEMEMRSAYSGGKATERRRLEEAFAQFRGEGGEEDNCKCGHDMGTHEDCEGKCLGDGGCGCRKFKPVNV